MELHNSGALVLDWTGPSSSAVFPHMQMCHLAGLLVYGTNKLESCRHLSSRQSMLSINVLSINVSTLCELHIHALQTSKPSLLSIVH